MHRWYVCPLVTIIILDDGGTPTGDTYTATKAHRSALGYTQYSSAIGVGSWCLTLINATDFTAIDADPACKLLFEVPSGQSTDVFLDETLNTLGLKANQKNAFKNYLVNLGINTIGLTDDDTVEMWLSRITDSIGANPVRGILA